jgi:hypothetical protein
LPTDSFAPALARLDPANRALLDLSLRRGMRPEEIGDLLGTDPESVIVAREAALEQLAAELGLDEAPDLDDLRARLSALPDEAWTGQPEPEADDEEPEPRPQLTVAEAPAEPQEAEEPRSDKPGRPAERKSRLPLLLPLLAVAAVVLVIVLASGGDDGGNTASSTPSPAPQAKKPGKPASKASPTAAAKPSKPAAKPSQPAAPKATLTPVAGAAGATGTAELVEGGKRLHLEVSGLPAGSYEVWLYNSVIDATSIGKATGTKISLDVELPKNASQFRYVDVSREPADGNPNHSGESVLRVPLVKLSP